MSENLKKTMPKGRKKGGTKFPRINMQQAYDYSKNLVSKTHTSAQPENIILPGVFDNAGPVGRVRISAMKQYNLIDGNPKAYSATELAKSIIAAPKEELTSLLQKSFISPKIFFQLYETFKGNKTSEAKIKQQAIKLNVHPDSADECTKIFVESLIFSHLGLKNGEDINIDIAIQQTTSPNVETNTETSSETNNSQLQSEQENNNLGSSSSNSSAKSMINSQVNISVDPSMDPEKLEKLLKLLKQYGAL